MNCHICQTEAVARCYTCGELVCEEHGKADSCSRCSTGITAGDPRQDRFALEPLEKKQHQGWWRPRQAEEYAPPACYKCQGLTRAVCRNCVANYCADHAGLNGLCQECARSANLGIYVLVGLFVVVGGLLLGHWFFNR